jgi:hypothetical protein
MNFVIHQARTDLWRLRRWLLLWALLLAAVTVGAALEIDMVAGGREAARRVLSAQTLLLNALAVLGWVLAARIVHADPLDGTTAFWVTRPISPWRLLWAKVGSIVALFVAIPAAAAAATAAANGAAGGALARFVLEFAFVNLVFLLAVVLLASLTRDVARLVLAGIVAAIAWVTLHVLIISFASAGRATLQQVLVRHSALLVGGLVFCFGSLGVAANQYTSRRRRRSVALAAVTSMAAVTIVYAWPWNLLALRHPVADSRFDAAAVSVGFSTDDRDADRAFGEDREDRYVHRRFQAAGAPPGWAAIPLSVDARLRLGDGAVLSFAADTWLSFLATNDNPAVFAIGRQAFDIAGRAAGGRWLNEPAAGSLRGDASAAWHRGISITAMRAPKAMVDRQPSATGDYRATIACAAVRASEVAAVPLRAGAVARAEAQEITVLGLRRVATPSAPDKLHLEVRAARTPLLFPRLTPGIVYVLRNRRLGEIVMGMEGYRLADSGWGALGGARVRYKEIAFPPAAGRPMPLDDAWLGEAELVLVSLREEGTFSKTIHVPDFRVKKDTAADSAGR